MSPSTREAWKREFMMTFSLSLPLILTNLAQMAMTTTDVIFIGRLGSEGLAPSALGANLYTAIALFALGAGYGHCPSDFDCGVPACRGSDIPAGRRRPSARRGHAPRIA